MQYSPANNLIHRDLKTQNILIDEYLYPRITDFGLSKILHQNLDSMSIQSVNDYKGTPAYFSPEIWDSKNYSKSSDVYAFGFIVYELITGDLPFINMSSIDIDMMVANARRLPFRNEIPECYKDLIERCWAQDPDQRSTFDEIVTLLRENEEYVTETVNADEYFNYRDFIDETVKSFNSNKQIIFLDEFMIQRNRNVPQRANLTEKKKNSN